MADIIDRACEQAERERLACIERQSTAASRSALPSGVLDCVDCDEPIPAQRRARIPGAKRCVDCESAVEQRAAHFAR